MKTAVLGATGMVGQAFLALLSRHPWFEPSVLAASDEREGRLFGESTDWLLPTPLPDLIAEKPLHRFDIQMLRNQKVRIVFSALPSNVAADLEPELADSGFAVFSNAGAMRYRENVPIIIPEINPEECRPEGKHDLSSGGFVITNANCTTTGLALALAPLRKFGIGRIFLSTYQALSGAGRKGFETPELKENVFPRIEGEENKVRREIRKIFSSDFAIYPFCLRVPVPFGHTETVWIDFTGKPSAEDIIEAWKEFRFTDFDLPSLPDTPVRYLGEKGYPQSNMSFEGNPPGMEVYTGRVRIVNGMAGFVFVFNNIIRGAAGGSIANAELFVKLNGGKL
ncbi:MAG: aspartate-semialdehyde dehydrogenase [Candidatus Krumholzibacteriales bacterium]